MAVEETRRVERRPVAGSVEAWVRSTRAFSWALPMQGTPSPPGHWHKYCCVRSSLRSPLRKRTRSRLPARAKRSIAATKSRVMGAIRAEEGTGLPRTPRKNQAAPPGVCSRGWQGLRRSMHSTSSVTCLQMASATLRATVMARAAGDGLPTEPT